MRTIKTLLILFGIFSFNYGISQEKVFNQTNSVDGVVNNDGSNKNISEKRNVILQAVQVDPSEGKVEKIFTANILNAIEPEKTNNRKEVNLTARPIESEVPEVQRSTQTNGKRPETRNENRVELKATLVPSED